MSTTANSRARYDELTASQARIMRADQARLAALYAERVEQSAATGSAVSAHWLREYRRSTMRCRGLGERIREVQRASGAAGSQQGATVRHLARSVRAPSPTLDAA